MRSRRTLQRRAAAARALQLGMNPLLPAAVPPPPPPNEVPPPSLLADLCYSTKVNEDHISVLTLVLLFLQFKLDYGLSDAGYSRFLTIHKITWLKDDPAFPWTMYRLEQFVGPLLKTVRHFIFISLTERD